MSWLTTIFQRKPLNTNMGNQNTRIAPKYSCDVFLGGSCNPTTWRKTLAIPRLEAKNITYYNPQVDEWHEGLMAVEATHKEGARVLLFVIDNQTRGIASIAEAAYYIGRRRKVVLVIQNHASGGGVVNDDEVKDLNRGRSYIQDFAKKHNVPVFATVNDAIHHIIGGVAPPMTH